MVARMCGEKLGSPLGEYRMGFPSGEGGHIGYIRNQAIKAILKIYES